MPELNSDREITFRILPVVGFTFIAYFCIGFPLATRCGNVIDGGQDVALDP